MRKKLCILLAGCMLSFSVANAATAEVTDNLTAPKVLVKDYDETKAYETGDYVLYNKVMYQCFANTSGMFDSDDWTETSVMESLQGLEASVGSADELRDAYSGTPEKETSVFGFLGNLWYQLQNLFSEVGKTLGTMNTKLDATARQSTLDSVSTKLDAVAKQNSLENVSATLGSTAPAKADASNYDTSSVTAKLNYLEDRLEAVFRSASNGKRLLAETITGLGSSTSSTASFDTINRNIQSVAAAQYEKGKQDGTKSMISENFTIRQTVEYQVGQTYPISLLYWQAGMYERYAYFQLPTVYYTLSDSVPDAYVFDHAKNKFSSKGRYSILNSYISSYSSFYGEIWDATTNTRVLSCNKTEPVILSSVIESVWVEGYIENDIRETYYINHNNELILKTTTTTYTNNGQSKREDGEYYVGYDMKTTITEEGAGIQGVPYTNAAGGQYSFPNHKTVRTGVEVGKYTLYNTTGSNPYHEEWLPGYLITNENENHTFVFKPTQYARYDVLTLELSVE